MLADARHPSTGARAAVNYVMIANPGHNFSLCPILHDGRPFFAYPFSLASTRLSTYSKYSIPTRGVGYAEYQIR
jgi:hypothetical protein